MANQEIIIINVMRPTNKILSTRKKFTKKVTIDPYLEFGNEYYGKSFV